MKRFKHSLSHYKLATFDMGQLYPVSWYEVLPGDTIQQSSSILLRFLPMHAPVMHPVRVRLHHFFVPHRIVWDQWEQFITGGKDGLGDGAVFPTISLNTGNTAKGTVLDYLGVPVAQPSGTISALPVRSYNLIYNEFYRDQDLIGETAQDLATLHEVAFGRDYFTTARPWPQKGPDVTVPVQGAGTIVSSGVAPTFQDENTSDVLGELTHTQGSTTATWSLDPAVSGGAKFGNVTGLVLDSNDVTIAVDDLRRSMALQRYQEARAQFGSRYTEYLAYLGVRSADSRLQRPEYLGGGKSTVAFSEVLQTAEGTNPVGELRGHGISALRTRRFRRFFSEHGIVMTLLSVLPVAMYEDGIWRPFNRRTKEDFWQKELELIGQQEIPSREIFADGSASDDDVFGYQDRYYEYRALPSQVAGDFRDTLNFWHLGRQFATRPTLNAGFLGADPTFFSRIFASTATQNLIGMINHSIQARRMVTRRTVGRIL